ncbi:hypothetical protein PhCBS80983_g03742 [Powellomyces hirtus]|uniref:N-acetylgalactosaminide beta-1,3-galactosyltransferase n=1 Tax=Powellomyces hirtus TaxID=109895 RepID=A0A507E1E6_9FUNG|nr:hypothetical protein PhCBS80983_g03742 [Powellomyces hirtus]
MSLKLDHRRSRSSPSFTESTIAYFESNPRFRLLALGALLLLIVYSARSTNPSAQTDERGTAAVYRQAEFDERASWFGGARAVHADSQQQRPAPIGDIPPDPKDATKIVIAPGPNADDNHQAPPSLSETDNDPVPDEETDDINDIDKAENPALPNSNGVYNPRFDKFAIALKSGVDVVLERSLIQLMSYLQPVRNLIMIGDGEAQVGDRVMIDVINTLYGPRNPRSRKQDSTNVRTQKQTSAEAVQVDETSQGWKSDGHKNLPGFRELWNRFPNAEWFVMIDDDTYVFLDNLADRLAMYDPDGKHYFGAKTQFVGCDGVRQWGAGPYFAHGGSGIVVSRGAVREMMTGIDACIEKYKTCWAGDVRTALCLRDQGILLHSPSGFFSTPPNKQFWFPHDPCDRPLTFHHLLVKQIQELYNTEKGIITRIGKGAVTFSDIYWSWHGETEWQANFDRKGADFMSAMLDTPEDCKDICLEKKACISYVFDGRKCWLKDRIPPGVVGRGMTSGVLRERYVCNSKRTGFRK